MDQIPSGSALADDAAAAQQTGQQVEDQKTVNKGLQELQEKMF